MQPPAFLERDAARVEAALAGRLDARARHVPARLADAMRHALLGGGKRVRASLVLASMRALGADDGPALPAAEAVECIHAYSLVHDDLPAMDNDPWRRGRPSCWKAFDEATAILAGDALQALAFEILARADLPAHARAQLVATLAEAAGDRGMVGGQMLDLEAESRDSFTLAEVEGIHVRKTGALIRWCAGAAARMAGADEAHARALLRYGEALGLLFQIADDVLDATQPSARLGKTAGKDAHQGKATFVAVLGLAQAREEGGAWLARAVESARGLPEPEELVRLAEFAWQRTR